MTDEEDQVIRDLLKQFETIGISPAIEDATITLKKKHKIKLADAIIAATALEAKACLVTRNVADFKSISELQMQNPFEPFSNQS